MDIGSQWYNWLLWYCYLRESLKWIEEWSELITLDFDRDKQQELFGLWGTCYLLLRVQRAHCWPSGEQMMRPAETRLQTKSLVQICTAFLFCLHSHWTGPDLSCSTEFIFTRHQLQLGGRYCFWLLQMWFCLSVHGLSSRMVQCTSQSW